MGKMEKDANSYVGKMGKVKSRKKPRESKRKRRRIRELFFPGLVSLASSRMREIKS